MTPRPPCSTLFPYTTLFRSVLLPHVGDRVTVGVGRRTGQRERRAERDGVRRRRYGHHRRVVSGRCHAEPTVVDRATLGRLRSEEHTSELQSHVNLVCRLLLE